MDLMTILFGYFVLKSIFKETKQCDFENNYGYYEDCDRVYTTEDFDNYSNYDSYNNCICDFDL